MIIDRKSIFNLDTKVLDQKGNQRRFIWLDSVNKYGKEMVFTQLNTDGWKYRKFIHWKKYPFPYDVYIRGIKNPTDKQLKLDFVNRDLEALDGHPVNTESFAKSVKAIMEMKQL